MINAPMGPEKAYSHDEQGELTQSALRTRQQANKHKTALDMRGHISWIAGLAR